MISGRRMDQLIKKSILVMLLISLLTGCGTAGGPAKGDPGDDPPQGSISESNGDKQDSTGDINEGTDSNADPNGAGSGDDPSGDGKGSENEKDIEERITAIIKEMTLDEKIGQMFIIGFEGAVMGNDLSDMLKSRTPGGVILFRGNSKDPRQLLELINSIKHVNTGRIPLFISVDEEGGRISRMPDPISDIPSAAVIGEYGDPRITYEIGTLIAEEISSFGFNMDFAPVLDISTNPDNTVIGDRAFGYTAQAVSEHGIGMMRGIRDKGVIPVVKHFPGHGDTQADSHKELPVVEHEMSRLSSMELVPFQKAIDENADAVMIGHLLMKRIDPQNPAVMSRAVVTDLLREQMGFGGVVVTDDMTMAAITKNYDIGEAAVRCIDAGCDIILVCHGEDNQIKAMDAVKSAVEKGYIDEARIDESVIRILRLKAKYGLEDRIIESVDTEGLNKKIDGQLARWYNRG